MYGLVLVKFILILQFARSILVFSAKKNEAACSSQLNRSELGDRSVDALERLIERNIPG